MNFCTKLNKRFCQKVEQIAKKLNINPYWLLQLIYVESKFNPKAVNPRTDAVGLIQFTPNTRQWLGPSKQQLLNMSALKQLDYVYNYLKAWQKTYNLQFDNFLSLYLTVFYPNAVVKGLYKNNSYIIGSEKGLTFAKNIADQNPSFDLDGDGYISIADLKKYFNKLFGLFIDKDLLIAAVVGLIFSLF